MIELSGCEVEYFTASGAMGFDGRGWLWEKPLVAAGLIRPEYFAVALRSLTLRPILYPESNLSWIRPWTWLPWSSRSCVQFLPDQSVGNKVGLYNPGFYEWLTATAPKLKFHRDKLIVSLYGTKDELVEMISRLNALDLIAIEINVSCPNSGHAMDAAREIIGTVIELKSVSKHPLIIKLSCDQEGEVIARALESIVAAISLNSVPWAKVFGSAASPFEKIGKAGKGGVSGKAAQPYNWEAVKKISAASSIPVIAPSIMEYDDLAKVRALGAKAVSFGAIHCRTPWKPTGIVERDIAEKRFRIEMSAGFA